MGSKQAQAGANSETMSVLVTSDLDGTDALEKLGPFSTELNTHTHLVQKPEMLQEDSKEDRTVGGLVDASHQQGDPANK